MASQTFDINTDKAASLKMGALEGNSLPLNFKFYDNLGAAYDVSTVAFVFTVSDWDLTQVVFTIDNADWVRDSINEISYTATPFEVAAGKYKMDFTATFDDGAIRTLFDGELTVRERKMYV